MSLPDPSSVVADLDAWDSVVTGFVELQRQRAAIDAAEVGLLAGAMGVAVAAEEEYRGRRFGDRSIPLRSLVADLAVASGLSEWSIKRALNDAADLCDRFSGGVAALGEGRITRRHLAVIHDAGAGIEDDQVRAEYLRRALECAEQTTPGRLGPVVEAISAALIPRSIEERHATANARRGVWVRDRGDAMSDLILTIPSVLAHAGRDRATRLAQTIIDARPDHRAESDPDTHAGSDADTNADADSDSDAGDVEVDARTMDQLRADVLADLLLTGIPTACTEADAIAAIRPIVQVTVPVLTAAGVGDQPALLAGVGPIDAATARELLGGESGWERVMTSPVTGEVVATDRYQVPAAMKRLLRARDERCRFPGCRTSAWRCELDHTKPHSEGGTTCDGNLAALCKHHHILKHHGDWTVRQLPGGVLEWTSPSGRVSTDRPEPAVRFVPDERVTLTTPADDKPWLTDRNAYFDIPYDPHQQGPTGF